MLAEVYADKQSPVNDLVKTEKRKKEKHQSEAQERKTTTNLISELQLVFRVKYMPTTQLNITRSFINGVS